MTEAKLKSLLADLRTKAWPDQKVEISITKLQPAFGESGKRTLTILTVRDLEGLLQAALAQGSAQ